MPPLVNVSVWLPNVSLLKAIVFALPRATFRFTEIVAFPVSTTLLGSVKVLLVSAEPLSTRALNWAPLVNVIVLFPRALKEEVPLITVPPPSGAIATAWRMPPKTRTPPVKVLFAVGTVPESPRESVEPAPSFTRVPAPETKPPGLAAVLPVRVIPVLVE